MAGKFRLFYVGQLFESREDPGQESVNRWYRTYSNFIKKVNLEGMTGIVIFGPNQEEYLSKFKENDIYNILFISKKCVNPNHRDSGPRNTVVIFEEKK